MLTLLFLLSSESPVPGLAVACLNLIVALGLVCVSLLLGISISLLTLLHALATGEAQSTRPRADRRALA